MSDLLKINVNEHTERKNNLTYLSWAWAWAEVLKIDQQATWEAHEFNGMPVCVLPDESAMVKVSVTLRGNTKSCWLPVMDHKNKAIKGPDAFAVNTALVRCLTKCIGMHGLGLYIYAGEDLPEPDKRPEDDRTLVMKVRNSIAEHIAEEGDNDADAETHSVIKRDQKPAQDNSPKAVAARLINGVKEGDASGVASFLAGLEQKALDALWVQLPTDVQTKITAAWPATEEA